MTGTMLGAYTGPPELTWGNALTAWTLDLPAIVFVMVVGAAYLAGVRAVRGRGERWSTMRAIAFVTGLVVIAWATCGVLGVYAHVLFWIFTVQVGVLMLVAPLLLGAGGPTALVALLRGRPSRSLVLRVLRVPGAGPLLLIVSTAVLFFTPVLETSLRHALAFHALHLALVAVGLAMVLPVTDDGARLSSIAYAAMLGVGFIEFLLDAVPGIVLRLHSSVLAPAYWLAVGRPWGPTPLGDQQLAGSWLWFFAEAGDLPFLIALVIAWIRSDAHEAAEHDRAEDERLAAEAESEGAGEGPQLMRPWWETEGGRRPR